MKRNLFTKVTLALATLVFTTSSQAATYTVSTKDTLIDVLSLNGILLDPREKGTIWESFTIPASIDLTIVISQGSPIVVNCESRYDSRRSRWTYSTVSSSREDVDKVSSGTLVKFTERALLENRSGELLTPELIRSLDSSKRDLAEEEQEVFYYRYADATEYELSSYHPFNLGQDGTTCDVVDVYKPSPEELNRQVSAYQEALQEALAKKQAQERPVGIQPAKSAGDGNAIDSDYDEEDDLPEVWQPAFYRQGNWLIPTQEAYDERTPYIVRIVDRENSHYLMIDPEHDRVYDQLLAPEYGVNAHYLLCTKYTHWLDYTTSHEGLDHTRPEDDATLKTSRHRIPEDLIVLEKDHKTNDWKRAEQIKRSHYYYVIARDLIINGLIIGDGSLEDKVRLMALNGDIDEKAVRVQQETVGLLSDFQPRKTITFYCWSNELVIPTGRIAGLKIDPTTGNSFVIGAEPFRNEVDLRGAKGEVTLATTNGQPIGPLTLWEKNDREIMESLEQLERALTPAEEEWLDRYFAQFD